MQCVTPAIKGQRQNQVIDPLHCHIYDRKEDALLIVYDQIDAFNKTTKQTFCQRKPLIFRASSSVKSKNNLIKDLFGLRTHYPIQCNSENSESLPATGSIVFKIHGQVLFEGHPNFLPF